LIYLGKELAKKQEQADKTLPAYPEQRKALLLDVESVTKTTAVKLEQLQNSLVHSGTRVDASRIHTMVEEAIPLTLQIKFEKARMNSFELISHLEARSAETKNSKEHYNQLLRNITGVNNRITTMNTALSPDSLDRELAAMEIRIVPLTRQTPYTLLMMRVVEIGLPLLLSIFSIFFVLRFTLTEKRCHEIKDLITKRNLERLKEEEKVL